MTITTILFDAGDILYNKPNRKTAVVRFLTDRGYNPPVEKDPVEKAKRREAHTGRIETQVFFEWLMGHYGVSDPKDVADGIKVLREQQSDVHFFDGVPETLHELKRRGFKLGVVTNTFNSRSEKNVWFQSVGIDQIWDSYADSSELHVAKPDPAIYQAALTPLGVSAENAAFVGHAQLELDGAKAIGMTTIMFNPDEDCNVADFQIGEFKELLSVEPVTKASETCS